MLHMFLSISVVFVDCTYEPFLTKSKSLCNWQTFWFSEYNFSRFGLAWGGEEGQIWFYWGPNSVSAALTIVY
jgi:hypothetical protein